MDRLSIVIALAAVVSSGACDKGKEEGAPASRTDSVKAGSAKVASTEAFCDFHKTDDSGPTFSAPGIDLPAAPAGAWRWVNVWATWCKPCVEEMPRIAKWKDKLAAAGKKVEMTFISIDDKEEDITAFKAQHADAPASQRLADGATKSAAWFQTFGLDAAAPIPIHVFVSPSGHIRCARSASVREQDYAAVERLLSE